VRLNYDEADDIVVQPDLLVVCDKSKLNDGKTCKGAPDMVVEILSQNNAQHDTVTKLNLYRQYGVQEYWIINPDFETLHVHVLKDGQYNVKGYGKTDTSPVHVLENCSINLAEIFEDELTDDALDAEN
jgi:Uma2 family endonuclease